MPQYDYQRIAGSPGMLAIWRPEDLDSLVVKVPAQEDDVPIGGTTDGTYTMAIQGEEGTFTASFVASGNTADEIAAGLAANVVAQVPLYNVVKASAVGTPVKLAFIHPGSSYAITFPSNPGGNMSLSPVTSPLGTPIPLGHAVCSDDGKTARAPKLGDTAAQFWGCSVRNSDLLNPIDGLNGRDIQFQPGIMLSAAPKGTVWVPTETAVAVNDPVFFRVDAGAGQTFGAFGAVADGGKAVQVVGKYLSATTGPGQLALLRLANP